MISSLTTKAPVFLPVEDEDEAWILKENARLERMHRPIPLKPKSARMRLNNDFLTAMANDFAIHGATVIEEVRTKTPAKYLEFISRLVPKQHQLEAGGEGLILPKITLEEVTVINRALDEEY